MKIFSVIIIKVWIISVICWTFITCNYHTEEKLKYMKEEIQATFGKKQYIEHGKVYQDVLDFYRENEIANECPIYIIFNGERAVDSWVFKKTCSHVSGRQYTTLFEGSNLLTPMIRLQTDLAIFPIIRCILSHAWIPNYGILLV